jgi:hypothetical protein
MPRGPKGEKPGEEDDAEMRLGPRPASQAWTAARDDAQLLTLLSTRKWDRAFDRLEFETDRLGRKRRAILNKRRLAELGLKAKGK